MSEGADPGDGGPGQSGTGDREPADREPEEHGQIDAVLAAYFEAREIGRPVSPEDLLRLHPHLREELERFFEGLDVISDHAGEAPARSPELPAEARLDDFEILEEIGRGGMGVVYRARQRSLGREVAIKMIAAGRLSSASDVERFRREATAAAGLDHPGIVSVHEVGEHEGVCFFTMPYVPGGDLAALGRSGPMEPRRAARLAVLIAEAVAHAHDRGVLHRDLKPANILLDASGSPRIADFGLARLLERDESLTATGAVLGTPNYMAPEQVRGERDAVGPAADIYSIGAILYFLLSGRPPAGGVSSLETMRRVLEEDPPRLRAVAHGVPADIEAICLKCLEKEPARRYCTARELALDLERFLAGESVVARAPTAFERGSRWCRRHPAATAVGALLLVLAAGSTLAALVLQRTLRKAQWNLRQAYVMEARSGLAFAGGELRTRGLEAIRKAAAIAPGPELTEEAIACMALVGLAPVAEVESPGEGFACFSPAQSLVAFCDRSGDVSCAPLLEGGRLGEATRLGTSPGRGDRFLRFSPDGRLLAAFAPSSGDLRVWRITTGSIALDRKVPGAATMDFSPGGERVAVGSHGGAVLVIPLDVGAESGNGDPGADLRIGAGAPVRSVRFSPRGDRLAFMASDLSENGAVKICDLEHGGRVEAETGAQYPFVVAWHPHAPALAVGCAETIRILAVPGLTEILELSAHEGSIVALEFHPSGELLASSAWDGTVRLWDVAFGREVVSDSRFSASALGFSATGDILTSSEASGGRCRISRVILGDEFRAVQVLPAATSMALHPRGRLLVAGNEFVTALVDVETRRIAATLQVPFSFGAFRPDGSLAATASLPIGLFLTALSERAGDGSERILRAGPARLLVSSRPAPVERIRVSADGRRLAAVLHRHCALVVDIDDPAEPLLAVRHAGVHWVSLDPRGERLATASHLGDRHVRVWEVATGKPLHAFDTGGNCRAEFSPGGRWLAIFGPRGLRIVDSRTWKTVSVLPDASQTWAFDPRETMLAVSRTNRRIEILEPPGGRSLAILRGRNRSVIEQIAFSPDSTRLLALRRRTGIEVWDLQAIGDHLDRLGLSWEVSRRIERRSGTAGAFRIELDPSLTSPLRALPAPVIPWSAIDEAAR